MKKRLAALFALMALTGLLHVSAAEYASSDIVGKVAEVLRAMNDPNAACAETPLGNAAADAVRAVARSDIAIVNGGDINANLQAGNAAWKDVLGVFAEDRTLSVVKITPSKLKELLEAGVGRIVLDGTELDLTDDKTTITLAATDFMLGGGYGLPKRENAAPLGVTLAEAFARYIASAGTLENPGTGRVSLIGSRENGLASGIPSGIFVLVLVIMLVLAAIVMPNRPISDRRQK